MNSGHEKPVSVEGLLELVPQHDSKHEEVDSSTRGFGPTAAGAHLSG